MNVDKRDVKLIDELQAIILLKDISIAFCLFCVAINAICNGTKSKLLLKSYIWKKLLHIVGEHTCESFLFFSFLLFKKFFTQSKRFVLTPFKLKRSTQGVGVLTC